MTQTVWAGLIFVVLAPALASPSTTSATDLIRLAIVDRLGADADVTVLAIDVPDSSARFREARPDPAAWLGRPVRFTLVTESGAGLPVVATIRVVTTYTIAKRAIGRGHVVGAGDVETVRRELQGTPIRPMPGPNQITGARALRPIPEGAVILTGFIAERRAVEPGDRVTVVAVTGDVEVSAEFQAADGGRAGDVIRVVNPETRKYLRGRIVRKGLVEVIYGR
jgi:flagella basal body P-ring formation protein FlgA